MIRFRVLLALASFLALLVFGKRVDAVTVHLIGDSTMAERDHSTGNPEYGWGEMLSQHFLESVEVLNAAAGGRSAKSFIDQGLWARAKECVQPGDWVVIQFGHNDQKKNKPLIYSPANGEYCDLLTKYVEEVRALGASPILVSSIYRRVFSEGLLVSTLGEYPAAVFGLAADLGVPFVDLHRATGDAFAVLGVEGTLPLFVHLAPGKNAYFPEGRADNSHLSRKGALCVARLFIEQMRESGVELAAFLRANRAGR